MRLNIPGIRLRGNVWVGEGVEIDDVEEVEGPAFVGNYCRLARDASVGAFTVLSNSVTLRERTRVARSVVDASTHIGRSTLIEGAILGRSCDIRDHVRIHEGVAIGDEVVIGAEASVMPGVRIYPYKEVETGAQIHESLIWESRATSRLFDRDGVSGLVNVDLTPETAMRLATALGTALKRGARVVASRDSPGACRMLKRAMISGLNSTGVDVADLRVSPPAIARHVLKTQGFAAAIHVGASGVDPEMVQIRIFEPPGIELGAAREKESEKHCTRQELRRVGFEEIGKTSYPARVRESYVQDVLDRLDRGAIEARRFQIVVDLGFSAASFVLPLVTGPLGVEAVTTHGFFTDQRESSRSLAQAVGHTKRIVTAVGADFGAVFDRSAERIAILDETGRELSVEQTLLLLLTLLGRSGASGTVAVPVTLTHQVERIAAGTGLQVRRTQASLASLTKAAAEDGVVFAGAAGGGYVFPEFTPAYDAIATLSKLLELLAPEERPLSELVAELPPSTRVHRQLACPWSKKGLVMRLLNEQLQGRTLDLLDGIKVFDDRGWAQVLPDPDEPIVHLYAEGETEEDSEALEAEFEAMVNEIVQGDEDAGRTLEEAKASS